MSASKLIFRWILAIVFVLAGIYHFVNPAIYLRIMPPYLPVHLLLIYLSGFFQIVLGVLLVVPKFTRRAAWGVVGLLIAVFPANIFIAMNTELFPEINPILIWLRLPLQFVMMAWAYWFTSEKLTK
ncbi:MAG: DoxX family membrane protein [Pyrinomonadaceae bacterium]